MSTSEVESAQDSDFDDPFAGFSDDEQELPQLRSRFPPASTTNKTTAPQVHFAEEEGDDLEDPFADFSDGEQNCEPGSIGAALAEARSQKITESSLPTAKDRRKSTQSVLGYTADLRVAGEDWADDFEWDESAEATIANVPKTPDGFVAPARTEPSKSEMKHTPSERKLVISSQAKTRPDAEAAVRTLETFASKLPAVGPLSEKPPKEASAESEWELARELEAHELSIAMAQHNEDQAKEMRAHLDVGMMYRRRGLLSESYQHFDRALKTSEQSKARSFSFEAECIMRMSEVLLGQSKNTRALEFLKRADILADEEAPRHLRARIQLLIGTCLLSSHELLSGAESLVRAITLALPPEATSSKGSAKQPSPPPKAANKDRTEGHVVVDGACCKVLREACYQAASCLLGLESVPSAAVYCKAAVATGSSCRKESVKKRIGDLMALIQSALEAKKNESESDEDSWAFESASDDEDVVSPVNREFLSAARPSVHQTQLLQILKNSLTPNETQQSGIVEEELFPANFKLISDEKGPVVNIIKYPKPTLLFSLATPDGRRLLTETQLESWLSTIVSKHEHIARRGFNQPASLDDLNSELRFINKYSVKWALKYLEYMMRVVWEHMQEHGEEADKRVAICDQIADSYFRQLAEFKHDVHYSDVNPIALCNVSVEVLRMVARFWRIEKQTMLKEFIGAITHIDESYQELVSTIELEGICHAKTRMHPEDATTLRHMIVPNLASVVCAFIHDGAIPQEALSGTLVPRSPSDLFDCSALELPPSPIAVACEAVLALHCFLNNMSPLTLDPLPVDLTSSPAGTFLDWESSDEPQDPVLAYLSRNETRIVLLRNLYISLPSLSFLKATAATALGLYFASSTDPDSRGSADLDLAEQLLFEACFVLDMTPTLVPSFPTIMRKVGMKALTEYAEVLLQNLKFKYGAVALESAAACHRIMWLEDDQQILRRLAVLCSENGDWKRSFFYYGKILDRARQEGNVNEVVYLSEVLSNMFMERGEFRAAEECISAASQFVIHPGDSPSGVLPLGAISGSLSAASRVDSLYLTLQLKLAHFCLQGYYFERGIELLDSLLQYNLPHAKKITVMTQLAEAFLKKRWLKECSSLLHKLASLLASSPIYNVPLPSPSSHRVTAATEEELKIAELLARCSLHQEQYAEALFWVEECMCRCQPSNLAALGRFFYLRGKVFQAIARPSALVTFPTSLAPSSPRHDIAKHALYSSPDAPGTTTPYVPVANTTTSRRSSGGSQGPDMSRRAVFRCGLDLVEESTKSYRRAYEYFRTTTDDVRIAKAVARISETQTDHLFTPIAHLHMDFTEVCGQALATSIAALKDQLPPPSPTSASASARSFDSVASSHVITLDSVEQSATFSLGLAVGSGLLLETLRGYATMAELRYLQARKRSAQAFWTECRDLLFSSFMDGSTVLVCRGAPPGFISRLFNIAKRLVRLLLCFDKAFVNNNLAVIDTFLGLEVEMLQASKRPVEYSPELGDDGDSDMPVSIPSGGPSTGSVRSGTDTVRAKSHAPPPMTTDLFQSTKPADLSAMPTSPQNSAFRILSAPMPLPLPQSRKSVDFAPASAPAGYSHLAAGGDRGKVGRTKSNVEEIRLSSVDLPQQSASQPSARPSMGRPRQESRIVNKVYENMSTQSLPLPRRNPTIASTRAATVSSAQSLRTRTPSLSINGSNISGTGSLGSRNSTSSGSSGSDFASLSALERIAERAWSCLFRMKQSGHQYSQGSLVKAELRKRNVQSLKRLHRIMTAMRTRRFHFSPSNSTDATASSSDSQSQSPSAFKQLLVRMDQEMIHRSVLSSDLVMLSTFFDPPPPSSSPLHGGGGGGSSSNVPARTPPSARAEAMLSDLDDRPFVFTPLEVSPQTLARLVYIVYVDNVVLYYVPHTGQKLAHRFGGRPPCRTQSIIDGISQTLAPHLRSTPPQTAAPSPPAAASGSPPLTTTTLAAHASKPPRARRPLTERPRTVSDASASSTTSSSSGKESSDAKQEQLEPIDFSFLSERRKSGGGCVSEDEPSPRLSLSTSDVDFEFTDSDDDALTVIPADIPTPRSKSLGPTQSRKVSLPAELERRTSVSSLNNRSNRLSLPLDKINLFSLRGTRLTPPMQEFLTDLITMSRSQKGDRKGAELAFQMAQAMANKVFFGPFEYEPEDLCQSPHRAKRDEPGKFHLPRSNSSGSLFRLFSSQKAVPNIAEADVPFNPLVLVCSHPLQAFPWELMFRQLSVRTFSLQSLITRQAEKETHLGRSRYLPLYFAAFSEDEPKHIAPAEQRRKHCIAAHVQTSIHHEPKGRHSDDSLSNLPFHTPLVRYGRSISSYRKKYKNVSFIELAQLVDRPLEIVTSIENRLSKSSHYPVFLFTFGDLLDLSEVILCLLSYRPDCTLLFVPDTKMRDAVRFLNQNQETYFKAGQLFSKDPRDQAVVAYKFFMSSIKSLQMDLHIPVVVINAPVLTQE